MKRDDKAYWKATLRLLRVVLLLWIFVSLGLSIILSQQLNHFRLWGYPLGFWFAQQGSIYTFVILIFGYAYLMGKIDRKFDVHEN